MLQLSTPRFENASTRFRPDRYRASARRNRSRVVHALRVGVLGGGPGGAQAPGGEPRWLRAAAVHRSCIADPGRKLNKNPMVQAADAKVPAPRLSPGGPESSRVTASPQEGSTLLTWHFRLSGWRDSNPRPLRPEAIPADMP